LGSASSNRLLPKLRVSSDCGTQPLANEAAAFADSRLVGREVALEVGAERVDQYDRLLAYVWTDGDSMFNEALLRKGLAQVYTVPPNDEYEGRFFDAQDRAASAGFGIWGLSYGRQLRQNDRGNGVGGGCVARPEPTPEPSPAPATASPSAAPANPAPAQPLRSGIRLRSRSMLLLVLHEPRAVDAAPFELREDP
jgi:hypothetical protein